MAWECRGEAKTSRPALLSPQSCFEGKLDESTNCTRYRLISLAYVPFRSLDVTAWVCLHKSVRALLAGIGLGSGCPRCITLLALV